MEPKTKKLPVALGIFIIIAGFLLAAPYISFVCDNGKQLVDNRFGIIDTLKEIKNNTAYRDYYQDKKKDVLSFYYRTTKRNVVTLDGKTVALSKEGYISTPVKKVSETEIESNADKIKALKDFSNQNGAKFLYVYAPHKNQLSSFDNEIENYCESNYNLFISALKSRNIETLDLKDEINKESKTVGDVFFITDGHWKPEAGFWANGKICRELNARYGFGYNQLTTDINNYNVKIYNNRFLGATGKMVGRYYSPLGIDDFSLITPNFDTDITEKRPFDNETKSGSFSETVIDKSRIKYKNLYLYNTYATYSGNDYRLQITINNKAENDDKILIIRDSFACVVTPFLTLNCKEVHTVDIRNYEYLGNDTIDLPSYIKTIKPDYVIVLYNSVALNDNAQFDFFK